MFLVARANQKIRNLARGGNGNVYVMFYCGFYSVDVAVAFLNHFLTVG
jgi:hypothetical protein